MSRLLSGVILVLTFLLINVVVAIGQGVEATTVTVVECEEGEGNETFENCQDVGKTSFLAVMLKATVSGIPGMPAAFNAVYVMVGGVLLVAGILLIVLAFVPTLGN